MLVWAGIVAGWPVENVARHLSDIALRRDIATFRG